MISSISTEAGTLRIFGNMPPKDIVIPCGPVPLLEQRNLRERDHRAIKRRINAREDGRAG